MEILEVLESLGDEPLRGKIDKVVSIIDRTLDLYGTSGTAFSFNGGKDSTVLLHLIRATVARRGMTDEVPLGGIVTFFFQYESDFSEVISFTHETNAHFGLDIKILSGDFKQGLESLIRETQVKAIILGTRKGDPNAVGQDIFCPSSPGWPPFMRVNPILDWQYHDVWSFLLTFRVPYCGLYDNGYTSLGSIHSTHKNYALLREDGSYAPASALSDARLERMGRTSSENGEVSRKMSDSRGTACLIMIGDEILRGAIKDLNAPYLCSELRSIGWRVTKIVTVPDDIEAISREVRCASGSHDAVLTSGGLGPTPDDVTIVAIADAFETTVVVHPVLEARIRSRFGHNVTHAHLKMARTPSGSEVVIIEEDEEEEEESGNGSVSQPSPFPLIRYRNVYVMPGVPEYLKKKWGAVKKDLLAGQPPLAAFHTLSLRLPIQDETQVAALLENIMQRSTSISVGSYPVSKQADGAGIVITLESKDADALQKAKQMFIESLPKDCIPLSEHKTGDAPLRMESHYSGCALHEIEKLTLYNNR